MKIEIKRQKEWPFKLPENFHEIDMASVEARVLAAQIRPRGKSNFSKSNPYPEFFDFHTQTASEMFGVKPEDVTPEQRRMGKQRNFYTMYGGRPMDFVIMDECPHCYHLTVRDRLAMYWGWLQDAAGNFWGTLASIGKRRL